MDKIMLGNRIIIALGSNTNPKQNMEAACGAVELLLPAIRWSDAVYTAPEACVNPSFFLNRVGIAYTSLSATELIRHFKQIERALGRVSESKHLGIIPMDIDLLQWNDDLLKPDDLQRSYIKAGISQLSVIEH